MRRREFLGAVSATVLGLCAKTAMAATARPDPAREDIDYARLHAAIRRFAETPMGRIAYIERGAGQAALFLHGFPLSSFQWRGALARLSPHRRCLAPDSLALGLTEVAPGHSVAPGAQVEMLAAFLDRLSIPAVDLVANDSGGAVAQLFVTRYPNRVRTLLLTNCDVEPDSPPRALQPSIDFARAGIFPDRQLAPWLKDKALARSPTGLGGLCYSYPDEPTDTALEEYLRPLVSSRVRKNLVNAYTLGLTPNPLAGLEARLKTCATPTRVIWGMKDTIFSADSPAYLARVLPNFRGIRQVVNGKLFFPEEYPDIVAEEARALWGVVA